MASLHAPSVRSSHSAQSGLPGYGNGRAFVSTEPEVELVRWFDRPLDGAVAAARTCYSKKGVIRARHVAGLQRVRQNVYVDDGSARRVDQNPNDVD